MSGVEQGGETWFQMDNMGTNKAWTYILGTIGTQIGIYPGGGRGEGMSDFLGCFSYSFGNCIIQINVFYVWHRPNSLAVVFFPRLALHWWNQSYTKKLQDHLNRGILKVRTIGGSLPKDRPACIQNKFSQLVMPWIVLWRVNEARVGWHAEERRNLLASVGMKWGTYYRPYP